MKKDTLGVVVTVIVVPIALLACCFWMGEADACKQRGGAYVKTFGGYECIARAE